MTPWHEEDRSGWWGNLHIWAPAVIKTPKWATHERLADVRPDEIVIADCCLCKMRADETVCQIVTGLPLPHGLSESERRERIWENYAEPYVHIECGPGFGCNVKPRRRASRHLREFWHE
jgi:hypothetical protein